MWKRGPTFPRSRPLPIQPHIQTVRHVDRSICIERASPGFELYMLVVQVIGDINTTVVAIDVAIQGQEETGPLSLHPLPQILEINHPGVNLSTRTVVRRINVEHVSGS